MKKKITLRKKTQRIMKFPLNKLLAEVDDWFPAIILGTLDDLEKHRRPKSEKFSEKARTQNKFGKVLQFKKDFEREDEC